MKLEINRKSFFQSIFSSQLNKIYIAAFAILFGVSAEAFAQGSNYTIIDAPGSSGGTYAYGINATGDIVGTYYDNANIRHGFKLSNGVFTIIIAPDSDDTAAVAINNTGDVVGRYSDNSSGAGHGFKLSDGSFTVIDSPGSHGTYAVAINTAGDVIGSDTYGSLMVHAFKFGSGGFTIIDPPGSNSYDTTAKAINTAGDVVGTYFDANANRYHGYKFSNGGFTNIDLPAPLTTVPLAINDAGDIGGLYYDNTGRSHGFKFSNGIFTTVDPPGSTDTRVIAINDAGDVAGNYDSGNLQHGFKINNGIFTTVDPPGSNYTDVTGMNTAGDVVGDYQDSSGYHGFKLKHTNPPVVTNVIRDYAGFFLKGFNKDNNFDVRVDWKGTPGRVRFQINNGNTVEVVGTPDGASKVYNFQNDFTPSFSPSTIKITPINGENVVGSTTNEQVYVFPYPTWLEAALSTNASALSFTSPPGEMRANFMVLFPNPEFKAIAHIPDSVPFIGGDLGIIKAQGMFSGYASSLGTGSLTLGGETKFRGLDQELSGGLNGNGTFLLNQSGLSVTTASFNLNLAGTMSKEVSLITAIPALAPFRRFNAVRRFTDSARLRGELTPSVALAATWKQDPMTRNLVFNESTGTIGLNLKVIVPVKINDHFKFQGWVAGGGNFVIGTPSPFLRSANINFEAGAQLNINGLFGGQQFKAKINYGCTYTVFNDTVNCDTTSSLSSLNANNVFNPKLELIQPKYERFGLQESFKPAEKQPNKPVVAAAPLTNSLASETIVSNVFENAEPTILPVGSNGKLLLWVRQNTSLPVLQSTEIAWSYYDGTSWSAPAVIVSDSRAEFSPVAGVDANGKVVAAWLKIKNPAFNTPIPTFDDLPLFYKEVEVVSAVFDPTTRTWSGETALTNDTTLDTNLRLARDNNGKLLLTWQSNAGSNFDYNTVYRATLKYTFWNGSSWNTPAIVEDDLETDGEHAVAVNGNNAFIVLQNYGELRVYQWNGTNWGESTAFGGGDYDNLLPAAAYDATGEGRVIWLQGANLVQAKISDPTPQIVRQGSSSTGFYNLRLLNNAAGNMILIWEEAVDTGQANIFAKVYYPASNIWGADRRLNQDERQSGDAAGYYDNNGNLQLTYLATEILRTTKIVTINGQNYEIPNVPENGQTDLNVLTVNLSPTAAMASISGRVIKADGSGISKASVNLIDSNGNARTALTNPFGYYRFNDAAVGNNYILLVRSKRYEFANPTQVLFLTQDIDEIIFTALP